MDGTRVKVQVAFLAIFLLGFVAGALTLTVYNRRVEKGRQAAWAGRFDRERYIKQMTEAVRIRPEQMGQLNEILDHTREEFLALRKRLNPQVEEVRQRARSRIREMLDAEQQARFNQFVTRWDEERKAEDEAASGPKGQERKP